MNRIATTIRNGVIGLAVTASVAGAAAALTPLSAAAATATPASASYYGHEDSYHLWDFDRYFGEDTCRELRYRDRNRDLIDYIDVRHDLHDYFEERGVLRAFFDDHDGWNSFSYDCSWVRVG